MEGTEQLTLFDEAEQGYSAEAAEHTKETLVASYIRKAERAKKEIAENLEHREMVCDLEDKHRKECGAEFVCIGKEFIRSKLNIISAQVFVVDIYRKVHKCAKYEDENLDIDIIKADTLVPVMKKSMATPATVAYVMQQKYQLGTPLYRQEQYWKSNELGRNTLASWIILSSLWFKPLWNRMQAILLKEDIIHADEIPLRVFKRNDNRFYPKICVNPKRAISEICKLRVHLDEFRAYS